MEDARADDYPAATRLLITADAGGSNGYRYRVWKSELAALAAEAGLAITVCHFPPSTSKWNKIEHRLFSHITHNWRGRPLTSHDVVLQTIAATRTRTGLTVEGPTWTPATTPPASRSAGPPRRPAPGQARDPWAVELHTLLPEPTAPAAPPVSGEAHGVAERRRSLLASLADPRLTGLSGPERAHLCTELAPLQAARAQERYSAQRGGRARRATGNLRGSKPLFDDAARVMLTLLYQRQVCSMKLPADMLEVTPLHRPTRRRNPTDPGDHRHQTGYAPTRFATAAQPLAFLGTAETPRRTSIMASLSHPRLTGMSREDLGTLARRLAPRQLAQTERASYQRRGAHRQPGSRGGVFPKKIGDEERVVLVFLYLRKLCTMDVLTEALGDVSRSSIGNTIREIRPLLAEAGLLPAPAGTRYRSAADLLTAGRSDDDTPTG